MPKTDLKHFKIAFIIAHIQHLVALRIINGRHGIEALELDGLVALGLLGKQEMHVTVKEPSKSH